MRLPQNSLEIIIALRKTLHQHPEVSGAETQTQACISSFIKEHTQHTELIKLQKNGLLLVCKGQNEGKNTLIRAELDALPITETNTFTHQSKNKGVSHKCGHDGHMSILCGLTLLLDQNRPEKGNVYLLFQPAEETGEGAQWMMNDPKFSTLQFDAVYALHNVPGYPLNQIVIKPGHFTCAVRSVAITLAGKTAHAGEPEKGINPALAIATLLTEIPKLNQADINQPNYTIATPIFATLGEKAYGVSAGAGEVHFTIRAERNDQIKNVTKKITALVKETSEKHKLKHHIQWLQSFDATYNHKDLTDNVRKAAEKLKLSLLEKDTPFTWGEDFGVFTTAFPGVLFGLGAGENTPALHHPDYDFPEDCLNTGIQMFFELIKNNHYA